VPVDTRYMRTALGQNIQTATSYNIISGSLSSGSLSDTYTSNDVYMVFASALVGAQQVVEVEFIGSHTGHMPFLQGAVELHGSIAVSLEITAYNYVTGAYETAGTIYYFGSVSTTDVTRYIYNLLSNKKYRSAAGAWKIKVKAWTTGAPAPSFSLYIDYLHYRTVAYQLITTPPPDGTSLSGDLYVDELTISISVWKVNADDSETLIASGAAPVTGPSETITLSATWTPTDNLTDVVAVMVGVYRGTTIMKTTDYESGGLPLLFITGDLNSFLNSVQWTVYYAFWWSKTMEETYYLFGTLTYNSRITNFTWGEVVPVGKFSFYKKGTVMICITS